MLFNSIQFIIFLPIVILIYFVVPQKIKNIWLLVASYYFYMSWNAKYAILICTSTVITYLAGIAMDRIELSCSNEKKKIGYKRICIAVSFVLNLGILGYFKYTNFFLGLLKDAFSLININLNVPVFDILLPVGISFYTFQALGYIVDIYRGEIYAEKNFLRYALFVSFFPQLVAGPIERSKNLLKQLAVPKRFSFDNLREGLFIMLWGFFVKLVIADRAAIFVNTVYSDVDMYSGMYIAVAACLFAIQIYCDFYGYSLIAKGSAKILSIDLMENFNYPYLRTSIADFWRGWHISLSTWFRDYLYIPLGGNRKGRIRKYINIMIVFMTSGLWHGASISFVIWGGLHGVYQIIGDILKPIRNKINTIMQFDENSLGCRIYRTIVTFGLSTFAFIFFRADSALMAFRAIKNMITVYNPWIFVNGDIFSLGLDNKNIELLLLSLLILLIADICKMKNIVIRELIISQNMWFRCLVVAVAITFILTFGIWGPGYSEASFIYFQF